MRFLRRSLVGLFLLATTAGLMAYAGTLVYGALETVWSKEQQSRPANERVFAANVVTLEPQTISPVLTTFGEVRSRRTLELRASAGGEVIWLSDNFEEGGQVSAGETLLRIDPVEAESNVATARADLAEAEGDLRDAQRSLALAADEIVAAEDQARLRTNALMRQQNLLERGVGSTAAVETAELALSAANQAVLARRQAQASAQARVDQSTTALERRKISLGEAERRLAETEITAGFDGVLSGVSLVEGGLVSASENLAQLIDPSALEVSFRVSTSQYTRLLSETGQLIGADVTASIDILGVDLEAKGKISRESAEVGEGQTGRLIFARLDSAPGFRPGDFVSVQIKEPPLNDVVKLPATAVDAAETVLVLDDENRLEVANVQLLRREGDDVIIRVRGIVGREVVSERTPLLGAGIKVRPVRRGADGAVEAREEPEMLSLDPERRARLVAFVEGNQRMPAEAKARILAQLQAELVPAPVVARIEGRMGG